MGIQNTATTPPRRNACIPLSVLCIAYNPHKSGNAIVYIFRLGSEQNIENAHKRTQTHKSVTIVETVVLQLGFDILIYLVFLKKI